VKRNKGSDTVSTKNKHMERFKCLHEPTEFSFFCGNTNGNVRYSGLLGQTQSAFAEGPDRSGPGLASSLQQGAGPEFLRLEGNTHRCTTSMTEAHTFMLVADRMC
jgi:hypothetical protein